MTRPEIEALDEDGCSELVGRLILNEKPVREWRIRFPDGTVTWPRDGCYEKSARADAERRGAEAFEFECSMSFAWDLDGAMKVVEKWDGDFELRRQNGQWRCTFYEPSYEHEAWAENEPLAICRAALIAHFERLNRRGGGR